MYVKECVQITIKNVKTYQLEAKDVLPNKPQAGRRKGRKMPLFLSGDLHL